MSDKLIPSPDYAAWLVEVKSRIQSARISAARSVNRDLILLYWDIGRGIVEKREELGWGKPVVEQLSLDLRTEFPGMKGISANNLWLMRQFYSEFSSFAFLEQLVQEVLSPVPWGHLVEMVKHAAVIHLKFHFSNKIGIYYSKIIKILELYGAIRITSQATSYC